MTIERIGAREAARRTRHLPSWPGAAFAQRYVRDPARKILRHLSDPEVMAVAMRELVTRTGANGLLVTPVVDRTYEWDESGREHSYDSRRDEPWWREEAMAKHLPPARCEAVSALFREAGVRRGFFGGIVGRGRDLSRVAEVLAAYAYGLARDYWFACEGARLAFLACHEGDLHIKSPDRTVLASCAAQAEQLGLKRVPSEN